MLMRESRHGFSLLLVLLTLSVNIAAEPKTYKVEDSCLLNGMIFSVGDDDEYELTYNGHFRLAYSECAYRFSPSNNDSNLCIKPNRFNANDCRLQVEFSGGATNLNYSCKDDPGDYCYSGGKILTVKFLNGNLHTSPVDIIEIRIEVDNGFNFIILAIILSVFAFLGIVSFVSVKISNRCGKKPRGDRVSPAPSTTNTSQSQSHRSSVETQSRFPSTHEMSTQYSPPTPDTTDEQDGLDKQHSVSPPNTLTNGPESSRSPLVPSAPSYDSEPPPSYEEAMSKNMDG